MSLSAHPGECESNSGRHTRNTRSIASKETTSHASPASVRASGLSPRSSSADKSWGPIVTTEYAKGARNFAVLSGRHGDQYGQVVDVVSGAFGAEVRDQTHFTQDVAEVSGLSGRLQGVQINVVNVGVAPYNKVTALRTLAASQLDAGQTVIFAWCFSIFSVLEHPEGVPAKALQSYMLKACNTTVAALVTENYA